MIDKIKLNISYSENIDLNRDMEEFKCFKNSGDVNRSLFLNKVIYGMYKYNKDIELDVRKKLNKDVLSIEINEKQKEKIISSTIQSIDLYYRNMYQNYYHNFSFMIYPGKEFKNFYVLLLEESKNMGLSLSAYIRMLIFKYTLFNSSSRESIYKYKETSIIRESLEKRRKILVIDDEKEVILRYGNYESDSDKTCNYVLGFTNDNNIYVNELCNIKEIFPLEEKYDSNDEEIDKLLEIRKNVEYYNLKTVQVEVTFVKKGKEIFNNLSYCPRIVKKKRNYTYIFDDTRDNIFEYLKLFGNNIIINDKYLINRLKDYYQKSYLSFDEK